MELNEIDKLLERYTAAETRIGANLHDLSNNTTYSILSTAGVQGRTASKVGRALTKSRNMWELFGQLQGALSRARTTRGTGSVSKSDRELLAQILTGESVVVDVEEVPFGNRDLMSAARHETTMTIEALLSEMRRNYESVRDAVVLVADIHRDVLPRLDAAETTLIRARSQATELGISAPELTQATREVERVRRLSLDDPLALGSGAGDELDRMVRLAAGRVADAKSGHDQLRGDLGDMEGLIAEIRTLRARADAARKETESKITSPIGLVRVPNEAAIDGPNGLTDAADAVLADPSESWQAQRQRLDQWLLRARKLRSQLARAENSNRRDLSRRDELRGLLTAYRAKMAAMRRAEDPELRELAMEAHSELFTAPTDLANAERLVSALGNHLAGVDW